MSPRPGRTDVLISAAFALWVVVEVLVGISGPVSVDLTCGLVSAIALAWRRVAPLTAGLCCAGGLCLKSALGVELDGLAMVAAIILAAYSVGRHRSARTAAWTLAAMAALGMVSLFGLSDADRTPSTYPFIALCVGAPGLAGAALRLQVRRAEDAATRAVRAEVHREEHARRAVQVERERIARELHDTVAHAVSLMVLQSGAVRSRLPHDLVAERDALTLTEDTGREAIAELHQLLGVLRSDDDLPGTDPQPTLGQLDRLVEESRRSGLHVEVSIDGARRPLEPALEVSAYRILQESLTNVRKHARAGRVRLRVGYGDDWLHLQVSDDGVGTKAPSVEDAEGFGLIGIRERVEMYGGTLSLTSSAGQGFTVDAALPVRAT
jgi:signal transduction histidine kinase